ncbi:hypothetical protein [Sphingomonas sp. CARO-RG-8B-R24-01]|uniref:hypothetical protein n=1 Tax=Sphingomonas sp. CARO-RG-8B-R24-01 TaxID=2914831 RepID=UPI001F599FDD|nr:hypothetical protein [Sphingomonas sp. CARO-RG-8B-R24-01]
MSSQYRNVEVAPVHFVPLRLLRRVPAREGKVLCAHRTRAPVEVDQAKWDAALPHLPTVGPVRMRGAL